MTDPRSLPDTATPAEHALHWAHEAQQAEAARDDADNRWHEAASMARFDDRDSDSDFPARMREAERDRAEHARTKDNALTMANMWAAVAAIQPTPAAGQCPILLKSDASDEYQYSVCCQYPDGHTGVHRTAPDSAEPDCVWTTDSPNAWDLRNDFKGEQQ